MITAEENFGKRLSRAREAKGLSVEEAARATRIRPVHIQALESSNLSRFPNAAYAKSFLLMYGKFLGVEIKEVADTIDTTTQVGVQDFQYLTSRAADDKVAQKAAADTRYDFVVPNRESRSWLPLVIGAAVIAIGGLTFVVSMNLNRIEDKPDAKGETAANPTPKPGEATQPAVPVIKPTPAPATAPAPGPTPGGPALVAQTNPAGARPVPANAGQVTSGAPAAQPQAAPAAGAPRPGVVATLPGSAPVAVRVERDPDVPKARPISPVASIAADDSAALASIPVPAKPVATPGAANPAAGTPAAATQPVAVPVPTRSELSVSRDEADVVLLQPRRKTWVVIRNGPGGQAIYEDYLYPSARPMRLPAGKYYIELKEADAVSIVRNGKPISYVAGGVMVQ